MNIVIVTSGHPPYDERIFYKFAVSLKNYGYDVAIVCSTEEISIETEGIRIKGFLDKDLPKKEKIGKLFKEIVSFSPSVIICCEPLPVLAAFKYKTGKPREVRIIYDITEYYPHQNLLNKYKGFLRLFQYIRYFFFNAYASNLADYLFIGEKGKAKIYNIIAPMVKKTIIGYYPPQRYFTYSPPVYDGTNFTLCYAGSIAEASGFIRFLTLVKKAAEQFPDKIFTTKIIGPKYKNSTDLIDELTLINNIRIVHHDFVSYKDFSAEFKNVDLCIDLRDKNVIFNKSLPIKVFDYIACGKPFIFSNLESFEGFDDLLKAGLLVDPDDIDSILNRISLYLDNPEKLKEDSLTAHKLFREKYNWETIELKMIGIINSIIRNL